MTKPLGKTKITVQDQYNTYEFDTNHAAIGSNTGGANHFLTTGSLHNMRKFPTVSAQAFSSGGWSIKEPETPKECPHAKALIGAAKAQERATLRAARIIEVAQEQAEAVINDADHTLNMAIQAYIHTGKSALDADRVLEAAGIYSNECRTGNVSMLNTEDLYKLDATELLTVG